MTNNTYDSMYYSAFPHAVKLNSEQGVDKDGQKLLPPQILAPSAFWSEPIPSMQIPPIPQPPQLPPQLQEQLQQPIQPSLQENQLQQLLLLLQQQQKEIKEQKEQQQQHKAASSNVIFHTFIGAREIELLIREFNPSANSDLLATEWIKEIELLGKIYKWDPYLLMMYGTMRLGGVARMWYEYSLESIKNWDDFKRELINNFPRSIDSADILSKLIAKKRQSNETLEEYFHSIVKMGKRIKLPDETIKEYLIRGLEQSKDQIVLSSIGPCSLTEFLQHMQRLEMESRRNGSSGRIAPETPDARKRSRSPSPRRNNKKSRSPSERSSRESLRNLGSKDLDTTDSHRKPTGFTERQQDRRSNSPHHFSNKRRLSDDERSNRSDSRSRIEVRSSRPNTRSRLCRDCKTDHDLAENCPGKVQRKAKADKSARLCYSCRKEGHVVANCPLKKAEKEAKLRKLWKPLTPADETMKEDESEALEDYERNEMEFSIELGGEGDNAD